MVSLISLFSEDEQVKILTDIRNSLTDLEVATIDENTIYIVSKILRAMSAVEREAALAIGEESFVLGISQFIRHEFDLMRPNHPITRIWCYANRQFEGVQISVEDDMHPCHPINYSVFVAKQIWKAVNP
jgi:hypothetical protein